MSRIDWAKTFREGGVRLPDPGERRLFDELANYVPYKVRPEKGQRRITSSYIEPFSSPCIIGIGVDFVDRWKALCVYTVRVDDGTVHFAGQEIIEVKPARSLAYPLSVLGLCLRGLSGIIGWFRRAVSGKRR
jgi:hypothetical protein